VIRTSLTRSLVLLGLAAAGGCSAPKDAAFDPTAPPVRYYVSADAGTERVEGEWTGANDATLGYVAHRRRDHDAEVAIVYLHGIESHAGWFDHAGDLLAARGYDVFCLDRRGSGINREDRGFTSGHVDRYETLFTDISLFVDSIRSEYDTLVVTGLSWGGKLALAWALANPGACDGLVLITPGIRARVDVGFLDKIAIFLSNGLNPTFYVRTPIDVEMFTRDPEVLDAIRADPRRLRYATARFFMQSVALDRHVDDHVPENRLPILLFLAGQDRIIDNDGVVKVVERGGQRALDVVTYEDQVHSIQFDAADRLVTDMASWIERRRAPESTRP
jgi:alpha-beta hydrolase superfamily lysophospholipase